MTALEKIATSLESSRAMQEIDFGKTALVWVVKGKGYEADAILVQVEDYMLLKRKYPAKYENAIIYKAPTTDEMIRALPKKISVSERYKYYLTLTTTDKGIYKVWYGNIHHILIEFSDKSPKEALAKLCLWCKKEGYL